MKPPSITAIMRDGQWAVAYIGTDAGPAKQAYTEAVNANAEGAMLFIRPDFARRFRGNPPKAPEAQPEAQPKKRKAS